MKKRSSSSDAAMAAEAAYASAAPQRERKRKQKRKWMNVFGTNAISLEVKFDGAKRARDNPV